MPAVDIKQQILDLYKQGLEDCDIAQKLGIDEGFVADVIDAAEEV